MGTMMHHFGWITAPILLKSILTDLRELPHNNQFLFVFENPVQRILFAFTGTSFA